MKIALIFTFLFCLNIWGEDVKKRDQMIESYRLISNKIYNNNITISPNNKLHGGGNINIDIAKNLGFYNKKYEMLFYYEDIEKSEAIIIEKNKLFVYSSYLERVSSIRKEKIIQDLKDDAFMHFGSVMLNDMEAEEMKKEIDFGYEKLYKIDELNENKIQSPEKCFEIPKDLKDELVFVWKKLKKSTTENNEWEKYANLFAFMNNFSRRLEDDLRLGDDLRPFQTGLELNAVERTPSSLSIDDAELLGYGGTIYQLGFDNELFAFSLPSWFYPSTSIPYQVDEVMDKLRSYANNPESVETKTFLLTSLSLLNQLLDSPQNEKEWIDNINKRHKSMYKNIQKELVDYSLIFPNRPLRGGNCLEDDYPDPFPEKFDVLCYSYSFNRFSKIFILNGRNLTFFELDLHERQKNNQSQNKIDSIINDIIKDVKQKSADEKEILVHAVHNLRTAKQLLVNSKSFSWKKHEIKITEETALLLKNTWQSLDELTKKSSNSKELFYFFDYYPTILNEERPLSHFQKSLQVDNISESFVNPRGGVISFLGFSSHYFGAILPDIFYKSNEIPCKCNKIIEKIFQLSVSNDSLNKQKEIDYSLKELSQDIERQLNEQK